ncbi:hypothetical protein [Petrotoga sp. DB-2]
MKGVEMLFGDPVSKNAFQEKMKLLKTMINFRYGGLSDVKKN